MEAQQMPGFKIDAIIDALRSVLPADGKPISLHEPCFSGNEWTYVKECIDTGWVSSVGKFVDRFENDLAAYTDTGTWSIKAIKEAGIFCQVEIAGSAKESGYTSIPKNIIIRPYYSCAGSAGSSTTFSIYINAF